MTDCICAACGATAPADAASCPTCGEPPELRGRYRLEAIVGHGAVGTTYRARDGLRGEVVAVKEMPLRPTTPADQVQRIEREARVLGELNHDRIPALVDHFTHGRGKHRAFYLVQQFVDGPTLQDEIKARRSTEDEVLGVLDEICAVLDYLHTLAPPVVHRDLKPKNLIRRADDGALILIDFGAVRDLVSDPAGGSTVAGTYGYMAPEQFRGEASARSDLYSLGAIAVQLLSRRDLVDLAGVDHRLDWERVVHASEPTRALIRRLLAQDPAQRPASARRVRDEIAKIRAGEAKATAPTPTVDRYRPPPMPTPTAAPGVPARPVDVDADLRRRMGAREKKWAILLAVLGAFWGMHNVYLQRYFRFFLSVVFSFTFVPTLLSWIDAIRMARMDQRDFDAKYNPELMEYARGDTLAVAEEIKALHALVEQGALTEAEFQEQKAALLRQRAPSTFARLGQGALEMVFEHFGDRHDLPAELAEQLRRSRRHFERQGWIRRRAGGYFAEPGVLRPDVQTIIHPARPKPADTRADDAPRDNEADKRGYRSTRYRGGRHRDRDRERE